jgi:hypothetical protein
LGGVDVVSEGGSVIAPPNSTQELDPMPGVIVTSRIEGAIASSNFPQAQSVNIPQTQLSREISLPVPPSAKSVPVVPKKLTQEELNAIEDELKRLRINPDSCVSVIKKYWDNR